MSETLLLGVALVCLLEGFLPFVAPEAWKKLLMKLASLPLRTIRLGGLLGMLLGVVLVKMVASMPL